ncbi:porin [Vibrio sp. S4M6]|uniref:porin n=1 Tax=Vibrio sinus TaxID=2946865 RepID=UPI00202A85E0|nr:porin [Vibrio sinus]MCL9782331.1 porin [Vibrio sinus]
MKKTLIALAVLATAGTVNAAQIYGSDTSKVSLKGEIDSYLSQWERETSSAANSKTKTKYNPNVNLWAKIQIDGEHKLNDMFTAFGSFEIETANQEWKSTSSDFTAKFDDLYAGVKTDSWGVVMGEHGDWADSMDATEKDDISNEGFYLGNAGGHHEESAGHGIGFKFYGVDNLTLVADVTTDSTDGVDPTWGASANYDMGMFSLGASYQTGDQATGITTTDKQYAGTDYYKGGVSASMNVSGFYLAATYMAYEGVKDFGFWEDSNLATISTATASFYEGNSYGLAAAYTFDSVRLYSTYSVMSNDKRTIVTASTSTTSDVNNADVKTLLVGAEYTFTDNLLAFLEYQTAKAEAGVNQTGGVDLDADSIVFGTYYTF